MRLITTILLILYSTCLNAQVIEEMSIAEYKSAALRADGSVWAPYWVGGVGTKMVKISGSMVFTQIDGGQYNHVLLRNNGLVYYQSNGSTALTLLQYDNFGVEFHATYVECYFQTYIAVRDDGKIYARGKDSYLWFGSTLNADINAWTLIPNQPAVTFVKTRKGGQQGTGQLVALTNTGAVYTVTDNTTTWNLKSMAGTVDSVYASYNGFYIALIDGKPYGWGNRKWLNNGSGSISTYEDLTDDWGLGAHRIIDLAVNDNTIHYITEENKLYGFGDNATGGVGIGWEIVNRKELLTGNWTWYVWPWVYPTSGNYIVAAFVATHQQLRTDKLFKRVWASDYYAYYYFAQETNDSVYFWGRNKGAVGLVGQSDGSTVGIGWSNEATYPNAFDVLSPRRINAFANVTPSPSNFILGTINAGSNQAISSSSTTLSGSATAGHTSNWTYTIASYEWTKLSGTGGTIVSPNTATTDVTGLTTGTYTYQLKVTDNNTATITDTVTVNVSSIPLSIAASASYTGSGTAALNSTVTSPDGIGWVKWSVLTRPSQPLYKVFIGGSSTPAGSSGVTSVDSAWPNIYKRFLKQHNLLDTMYNRAIGGRSTRNGLPTSTGGYGVADWDTSRNITYATKRQVHLAMMGYASNDMTDWQPANHLGWFREIRDSAVAAGTVYYLTTCQPRPGYNNAEELKLRTIADSQRLQFNFVEAYRCVIVPNTLNIKSEFDFGDGIHLNNAGQRLLGNNVIATNPLQTLTKGSAVFANAASQNTTVSGLTEGTWQLMASVSDTNGVAAYQIVTIEVPAAPTNAAPTVNAGDDTVVTQIHNATLTADADDSDGTIQSYAWEKVSGPDDVVFSQASSASTQVTFVTPGTYVLRVIVFDNGGASAQDTVTVTVKRVFKIKRHGRFNFQRPD